jgi:hypothetical protein
MTHHSTFSNDSGNISVAHSEVNRRMLEKADAIWEHIKRESLSRGFFGSVALHLTIQDGTIQHLRRTTDQSEK